jgi:hypothetical protein
MVKSPFDFHETNGNSLHPGRCEWREGEFEPVRGDTFDGILHAGYAHQISGVRGSRGITGLDGLHDTDIYAAGSQGSSQSRSHQSLSNSRICPRDEEAPVFHLLREIESSHHGKKILSGNFLSVNSCHFI